MMKDSLGLEEERVVLTMFLRWQRSSRDSLRSIYAAISIYRTTRMSFSISPCQCFWREGRLSPHRSSLIVV